MIENVQQVLLPAFIGGPVALDKAAAQRDFVAELPVAARALFHTRQPPFNHGLLDREAAAAPAQPLEAGQGAQYQETGQRVRGELECKRERRLARLLAASVPADQRYGRRGR